MPVTNDQKQAHFAKVSELIEAFDEVAESLALDAEMPSAPYLLATTSPGVAEPPPETDKVATIRWLLSTVMHTIAIEKFHGEWQIVYHPRTMQNDTAQKVRLIAAPFWVREAFLLQADAFFTAYAAQVAAAAKEREDRLRNRGALIAQGDASIARWKAHFGLSSPSA